MDPRIIVIILLVGVLFGLSYVRLFPKRSLGYIFSLLLSLIGAIAGYYGFGYLGLFSGIGLWGVLINTMVGSTLLLLFSNLLGGKRK